MPYIEAKISKKLDEQQIENIKARFGKAIECIPGKSETWLMVNIEDKKNMFFKGEKGDDIAYVSVFTFGNAPSESFDAMTAQLCEILQSEAGICPGKTYVTYHEIANWGWNGANF